MKIEIDTDKLGKWCKSHLNWLVPVGLGFLSWFAAKEGASEPAQNGMSAWYYFLSIESAAGMGILGIRYFFILFDID
jgi:hypothetical protein